VNRTIQITKKIAGGNETGVNFQATIKDSYCSQNGATQAEAVGYVVLECAGILGITIEKPPGENALQIVEQPENQIAYGYGIKEASRDLWYTLESDGASPYYRWEPTPSYPFASNELAEATRLSLPYPGQFAVVSEPSP
jgi:hypothetical protein